LIRMISFWVQSRTLSLAQERLDFINTLENEKTGQSFIDLPTVPDSFHNTNSINGFRGMFGLNKAII